MIIPVNLAIYRDICAVAVDNRGRDHLPGAADAAAMRGYALARAGADDDAICDGIQSVMDAYALPGSIWDRGTQPDNSGLASLVLSA